MSRFLKQFIFVSLGIAILVVGGLVIYSATPSGNIKVNPILGHDLDLNALYYGYAGNNTVHDITTQDISISAWVKVDVDASNVQYVFTKDTASGATEYTFYLAGSNQIYFWIKDASNYFYMNWSGSGINDNKWHHIVGIIDRDTTLNCKIFLDGVAGTTRNGDVSLVGSLSNTQTLNLGQTAVAGGGWKLDGQIRDVKLYYADGVTLGDAAHWSDAQVLYQAQHPFDYSANAGTTTDYWRLDEGSGTTLYGKPTTGNNLTLSNVLAWTTQPKIKMVKQENTTTTGNNPVGWWKMDEGTGQYAYDVSGNGNTGTLGTSTVADGADPTWTTGKLGKGLSFDGVNDYVDCGSAINQAFSEITVSAWIKMPIAPNDYKAIIERYYWDWDYGFGLFMMSTRNVAWGHYPHVSSITNLSLNQWHYIVGTMASDGAGQYLYKIYIDGNFDNQATFNRAITTSTVNTYIGSRGGGQLFFNGLIDDVRIFNRALSAGEVAQMYNSTKDGYLGNIKMSTGLVGYWKLDDNNALTSVIDYSGKGNTGTAYSGTATSTSVLSTSTAMIGRAMSFDGGDDWVQTIGGDISNALTIGAWVKKNDTAIGHKCIVQKNSTWNNGYSLMINHTAGNSVFYLQGISDFRWTYSFFNDTTNWHYITATYNGSNLMIIYVDGALVASKSVSGTLSGTVGTNLYIGGNYGYFNGLIDEVKIWNYARSAEQIKQDYERGLKGLP